MGGKRQKLYAYVDESGQDTKGEIFLVSVVIVGTQRDALRRRLQKIEEGTRKRSKKWTRTSVKRREAYMRRIIESADRGRFTAGLRKLHVKTQLAGYAR